MVAPGSEPFVHNIPRTHETKLEDKLPSESQVMDSKCDHPMRMRLSDYYQWKRDHAGSSEVHSTPGYKRLKTLFVAHFDWEREAEAQEQL